MTQKGANMNIHIKPVPIPYLRTISSASLRCTDDREDNAQEDHDPNFTEASHQRQHPRAFAPANGRKVMNVAFGSDAGHELRSVTRL